MTNYQKTIKSELQNCDSKISQIKVIFKKLKRKIDFGVNLTRIFV